ncbi:hypothetical protein CROQUDRAFT_652083 [Cronartium quercuum f. sp. fusiforme G11]|uniref:Uncharacterized protein n=1 Tax=Cronartium quercuum f. sp. fusiforme G11 TaxID=708437 RepID=A0A9P6TGB7_9BASI|nr:hypothetical protein CROQUDRAFT_652083 [Cronartium quercuum f. sp. fusiforme G11]
MPISLYTLLSAVFLCAINTAKAGAPHRCTHEGPAGTTMTQQFVMYSATVTYYQKTTTIHSGQPVKRRRARRQAGGSGMTDYTDTNTQNNTGLYPSTPSGGSTGAQSSLNLTTIDLTPAEPNAWDCYAGSFQPPSSADCDVVISAQLYNSTGSLVADPGTYVFVTFGTCVTVFQNPEPSPYSLQYNWAELGKTAQRIKTSCLTAEMNNIGGAAMYDNYLDFSFTDVLISLQRYDSGTNPEPASNATAPDQSQNGASSNPPPNTIPYDQTQLPISSDQSQNSTGLEANQVPIVIPVNQPQNYSALEQPPATIPNQAQNYSGLEQPPVTIPNQAQNYSGLEQPQVTISTNQVQNYSGLEQPPVTTPTDQAQNYSGLEQTSVKPSAAASGNLYQLAAQDQDAADKEQNTADQDH